jgi:TPR repeat protein
MYFNGLGCEVDKIKAFEMYQKSAMQDNLIAQCNLGMWLYSWKVLLYYITPLRSPSPLLIYACTGVMYDTGEGCVQDKHKAFEMFQKSADQGYEIAQFNLGR